MAANLTTTYASQILDLLGLSKFKGGQCPPAPPIKISLRPLTKKFDDLCNSSNISKMAANFKLQVSHSHVSEVSSLNLLKFNLNVADSGPGSAHVFDLCVTLTPFTGLGRPEQLLLYRKPSNWSNKALRYPSDCFC